MPCLIRATEMVSVIISWLLCNPGTEHHQQQGLFLLKELSTGWAWSWMCLWVLLQRNEHKAQLIPASQLYRRTQSQGLQISRKGMNQGRAKNFNCLWESKLYSVPVPSSLLCVPHLPHPWSGKPKHWAGRKSAQFSERKLPDSVKELLPRYCSSPAFRYCFLRFLVIDTYWFACWSQCLLHCGQGDLHQCLLEDLLADGAAVVVILLPKHSRKKQAHTCLGLFTTPTGNWFLSACGCCITGAQGFEWPHRLVQLLQNHSKIYWSGSLLLLLTLRLETAFDCPPQVFQHCPFWE